MGSSKKKRDKDKDKESDRKHKRDKKDKDKKSRSQSGRRPEEGDELLNYALHDAVEVQQNVYDYGHGYVSKGEYFCNT